MGSESGEHRRGRIRASWVLPILIGAMPLLRDGMAWLVGTESTRPMVSLILNGAIISIALAAATVVAAEHLRRRRQDHHQSRADDLR